MTRAKRVFLGAFGQPGHAFPMLALGAELVRRGHEVLYETWSHWQADVEAAGMGFSPAPEYPVFPTRETPLQPYEAVFRAAGETAERLADFRPDLVVHDILTLAPALAGELHGVPAATLIPHLYPVSDPGMAPYAIGARMPSTALGRLLWRAPSALADRGLALGREQLNDTRRRLGLPHREELHGGLSRELCLVGTLPHLEYPRAWPESVRVIGPLFWEPPAPALTLPEGEGPLVLVAPSTAQDPYQRMLDAALRGLGGATAAAGERGERQSLRVLAATNRRPLSRGVRLTGETTLVNWLSYTQAMPAADLVVCHAGHGTLVRALACGTPVLAIPHTGDMGENAARVDWAGAGVRLPWRLLSAPTLRLAVQRALDPRLGLAERAAAIGDWARAHDGAAAGAEAIETWAGG